MDWWNVADLLWSAAKGLTGWYLRLIQPIAGGTMILFALDFVMKAKEHERSPIPLARCAWRFIVTSPASAVGMALLINWYYAVQE